jgi:hypothetical protein
MNPNILSTHRPATDCRFLPLDGLNETLERDDAL